MAPSLLRTHWQAFLQAVQFLTTLPTPRQMHQDPRVTGLSLLWYPAVGLLLGYILVLCVQLFSLPVYLQAALLLAVWVVLTGGLHLDGVADCADAWAGGLGDREKTLRLLGDPLAGTMAVVSLNIVLLLKWAALVALLQGGQVQWLWLVPAMARLSLLGLFTTTAYIRPGGLGEVLARQFSHQWGRRVIAGAIAATLVFLPLGLWSVLLLSGLLVFMGIRWATNRRLGGFTGDVAGAQVEIVELGLLLVLAWHAMPRLVS